MKKLVQMVGFVVVAISTSALGQQVPVGPDPSQVYVEEISYAGTGCPAGSVANIVSSDATQFTLLFDTYVASLGQGVPLIESRKNCQLNIKLHIPQGWTYTIGTVDYRGYAQVDPKVIGTLKSTYYFSGDFRQASAETSFTGPYASDYLVRDTFGTTSTVWSSCTATRNLNINTQVRLTKKPGAPSSAAGFITVDSVDGALMQIYHLQWHPC